MGSFADKAREEAAKARVCVTARLLGEFDDADYAEWERLVLARAWTALREIDQRFEAKATRRHAIGVCPCPDGVRGKGVLNDG